MAGTHKADGVNTKPIHHTLYPIPIPYTCIPYTCIPLYFILYTLYFIPYTLYLYLILIPYTLYLIPITLYSYTLYCLYPILQILVFNTTLCHLVGTLCARDLAIVCARILATLCARTLATLCACCGLGPCVQTLCSNKPWA